MGSSGHRRLLVFAKEPRPGGVKTRLAEFVGAEAACRLYRAFLADTAAMLRGLEEVDVEWWLEGNPLAVEELTGSHWPLFPQTGPELGERLRMAFERSFATGGGPVAAIGTDCPLLAPPHLRELFRYVEGGADACLIPAEDGGYVALALAAPRPEVFSRIPWSTASVLEATMAALRGAGCVVKQLSALYDVDELADVERLARDLAREPARAPRTAEALQEMLRVKG